MLASNDVGSPASSRSRLKELPGAAARPLHIRDPVLVGASRAAGVIRFQGELPFAEGVWFGVELKEPIGKHDGSVNGKRYFWCKPMHGVLVQPWMVFLDEEAAASTHIQRKVRGWSARREANMLRVERVTQAARVLQRAYRRFLRLRRELRARREDAAARVLQRAVRATRVRRLLQQGVARAGALVAKRATLKGLHGAEPNLMASLDGSIRTLLESHRETAQKVFQAPSDRSIEQQKQELHAEKIRTLLQLATTWDVTAAELRAVRDGCMVPQDSMAGDPLCGEARRRALHKDKVGRLLRTAAAWGLSLEELEAAQECGPHALRKVLAMHFFAWPHVRLKVEVRHLDCTLLFQDPALLKAFQTAVQAAVASQAGSLWGHWLSQREVGVVLTPTPAGVLVEFSTAVHSGVDYVGRSALAAAFQRNGAFAKDLVGRLSNLVGMAQIRPGQLEASFL